MNVRYLQENKVRIWNEWADENGDRTDLWTPVAVWPAPDGSTIDQIAQVEQMIKNDPNSRRMVVSAGMSVSFPRWRYLPCHCLFQFT